MRETEGRLSADWFFQEWVYGAAAPTYELQWSQRRGTRGFDIDVIVSQTQEGAVFTMPVDLAFHTMHGALRRIVLDSARTASATFTVPDSVTSVSLDPGNWILKRPIP
ncbi:MAG TPA: hypothetical protein VHE78_09400 [Gemmatimonadaceae bacterium]|nr:hypothetical protein [Gemmatimonadaceae bacterium]